ncbi:MAG: hypothetical protein A2103_04720 [Gammaproteobacteria bacterium GWF2_41_13]|nr:MAG: hypothetical protein A2103_04720 [Gammaproteobacteria bacterium GWF2_41_13]
MLKHRLITGIILLAITLLLLFYLPAKAFIAVTTILFLYAAWEWSRLIKITTYLYRILYVIGIAISFYGITHLHVAGILIVAAIFWIMVLINLVGEERYHHSRLNRFWCKAFMGILTLAPAWLALNVIRLAQNGIAVILFLLCLIWISDTGAYFIGRGLGKHRLAPHISPKKTWEGLYGGVLCALLIGLFGAIFFKIPLFQWPHILLLSFLTALFSVVGDLFESQLKRQAGLKDSGIIFPGHGGLLDRLDSLMAAAPVFLGGCFWLGLHFSVG